MNPTPITICDAMRIGSLQPAGVEATIMNSAAFLIGLAVVAVSVYTATLSRRAEYGTLKAVGAGDRCLYGIVTLQALGSVAVALATAVLLTLALSVVMPAVQAVVTVELVPWSVLKTSLVALAIAVLAAMLPVRQVASLDPATVFRKKMA